MTELTTADTDYMTYFYPTVIVRIRSIMFPGDYGYLTVDTFNVEDYMLARIIE